MIKPHLLGINRPQCDSTQLAETRGLSISPARLAEYSAPYKPWERKLVRHLGQQSHKVARYMADTWTGHRPNHCHHNVREYLNIDARAIPVLGWLKDPAGYVLHSLVEVDGEFWEVSPTPFSFAFVDDPALQLTWVSGSNGMTRAVITREGRNIPGSLRTAAAAKEWIAWAQKLR